jgi:hypothetical protein|tara:strand:- start:9113 stop:9718 length:606 start_codon:yes stop_codon:yes gene_type:complete
MSKMTKHVGTYGEKPCVIVFRELPEDDNNALVILSDSLEGQLHDDVMSVVDSLEAQASNNISEVMFRRRLTDGSNMLEALHTRGKLVKAPVEMVRLVPIPNQPVELAEINKELRKINNVSNPPLKTEDQPAITPGTVVVPEGEDSEAVAGNLLSQASLLEEDAKALLSDADLKRSQAYELAPDLRPKKGPGRPSKSSIEKL